MKRMMCAAVLALIPPITVWHDHAGWPATPEGATIYQVDHGTTPPVLLARAHQAAQTLMIGADAFARSSVTAEELVSRRGFDPATETATQIIASVQSQNGLTWIDPIVSRNRSFNVGNELTKLIAAGYTVGHAAAQDTNELQQLLDQYAASLGAQIDAIKAERDAAVADATAARASADDAIAARDQAIADRDAAQESLAMVEADLARMQAEFETYQAEVLRIVGEFLINLGVKLGE